MLRTNASTLVTALAVILGILLPTWAGRPARAQEPDPPRLVVLLVVDQFPADLLAKYDSLFTGGLRRLLDGGFHYTQASHAYAQTHTAAGHTTIGTGVWPATHGVVANAWFEFRDRDWAGIAAVADPDSPILGIPNAQGRSPANNQREGLADWVLSRDSRAQILTVSAKDRSAIGLTARAKGQVYWIDTESGRFVTSRYYTRREPLWMDAFNRLRMPDFFKEKEWASTVPEEWAHLSRRDTVEYEGDGIHTFFPHRFADESEVQDAINQQFWVAGTPAYDVATIDAALEGLRELTLGADDATDFLGVSLSQTDIVGHAYGPHSREQLDNLLRLDRGLDRLLTGLDEIVGVDGWVLAFTSDHGALPMPEYLGEQGTSASRTTVAQLQEMIVAARTAERDGDEDGATDRAADALKSMPLAEQVFTGAQLMSGEAPDSFTVLFARSYYPKRAVGYFGQMDVLVRFPENVVPTTREMGTDHRTGYWYDRHVPLIFFGAGVAAGESDVAVRAVDVAPTLANLIGLDAPDDLDGQVIYPGSKTIPLITDPVAILVVLAGVVWISVRLEERYHLFRSLGSALVGILGAMVLSNLGVIPGTSSTYEFLMGPAVSVGIALILFSVDVRTVFSAGPKMLIAFGIGAAGTAIGATVGAFMWGSAVGPEAWKLAGQFTGTYTGGGLNFAALGQALETSSDLFTAATAADVIVTAIWMAACLSAPLLFAGRKKADAIEEPAEPAPHDPDDGQPDTLERALFGTGRALGLSDVSALVVLAIGAVVVSEWLGGIISVLPEVLWLTTLSLALAQISAVRRIAGSAMLGNYLILLFLASNGARSVIANIFEVGPAVFYFAATTVAIHGIVIFGVGRLARLDAGTLAIASQANVGGAASAMAMATARGYADKLLPGVAVGLLGYAVGNYSGFVVAHLLRSVLGG